jgi:predicted house-cleaning noncanonical NTP pyrophosphatase (MazG superfamily)
VLGKTEDFYNKLEGKTGEEIKELFGKNGEEALKLADDFANKF